MKKMTNISISDWWITGFFGVGWIVFWGLVLIYVGLDNLIDILNYVPVVAVLFYMWLKAIVVDGWRIINKEKLRMPGYVYWVYGLSCLVFWMVNDMISSSVSLSSSLGGEFNRFEKFFYIDYPWALWLVLEVVSSLVIWSMPAIRWAGQQRDIESKLTMDVFKTILIMLVFSSLSGAFNFII